MVVLANAGLAPRPSMVPSAAPPAMTCRRDRAERADNWASALEERSRTCMEMASQPVSRGQPTLRADASTCKEGLCPSCRSYPHRIAPLPDRATLKHVRDCDEPYHARKNRVKVAAHRADTSDAGAMPCVILSPPPDRA